MANDSSELMKLTSMYSGQTDGYNVNGDTYENSYHAYSHSNDLYSPAAGFDTTETALPSTFGGFILEADAESLSSTEATGTQSSTYYGLAPAHEGLEDWANRGLGGGVASDGASGTQSTISSQQCSGEGSESDVDMEDGHEYNSPPENDAVHQANDEDRVCYGMVGCRLDVLMDYPSLREIVV